MIRPNARPKMTKYIDIKKTASLNSKQEKV